MALLPKSNVFWAIIALGGVALLVVLFYAEEDWRGKRAWEQCKADLEAKGETLDWNAYIPPPVPDGQNIFKAPKMQEWFVRPKPGESSSNELVSGLSLDSFFKQYPVAGSVTIAELTILPVSDSSNESSQDAGMALRYDSFGPAVFSEAAAVQANVSKISNTDTDTSIVDFQDVPITTIIEKLARKAGINYTLDPGIGYGMPDKNGHIKPEPVLCLHWENITARQALQALLDTYGFEMDNNPQTGVALIAEKKPNAEIARNQGASLPVSAATQNIPVIPFEDVPVTTAIDVLFRMLKVNYLLDPKIGYGMPDENGEIKPEPTITARWQNTSIEYVLQDVLNKYGLRVIYDPETTVATVTTKPLDEPKIYMAPDVREHLKQLFAGSIGTNAIGAQQLALLVRPPGQIKPVNIVFHSEAAPSTEQIIEFFTEVFPNSEARLGMPKIQVETTGTNSFRIVLDAASAADYLAWSDRFEPDFDLMREALKRPYARMDGDYSDPIGIPLPNFMAVRAVVQTLAQRAQCYLLLGQPEKALDELTLLNDSRRILELAPSGKTMTLVSAMINVAVTGLYADTVANGLRLHAWREPQLVVLQTQIGKISLTPYIVEALKGEPAGMCYWWEANWKKKKTLFPAPQGWMYQNMVNLVKVDQMSLKGFDVTNNIVSPDLFDKATQDVDNFFKHDSPSKLLTLRFKLLAAAASVSSFNRAWQTTAHNQTVADEAQIACALERYHLAHGEYPETLDVLVPQFIEKIPHDIIGGPSSQGSGATSQPLHYQRAADGKFLLYSVGWNETDDGGIDLSPDNSGIISTNGDWVWKN